MAQNKPLVIELTRDTASFPKGAQLGVDTESVAAKLYGDAYTIVGYQDGSPYEPAALDASIEQAQPEEPPAPEETAPAAEQQEV